MTHNFFATLSRMKYIERWALMRNARTETLSEHTLDVAMIAHALCVIGNVRYGRSLDADRAALIGLYHDASEIITGDMPTPVKYYNRDIRDAYKEVEHVAEKRLLEQLPEDIRGVYAEIFDGTGAEEDKYMRRLVKAADKLSHRRRGRQIYAKACKGRGQTVGTDQVHGRVGGRQRRVPLRTDLHGEVGAEDGRGAAGGQGISG